MTATRAIDGRVDVAVVGGGIVGLATARALLRRDPSMRVAVLEKEGSLAGHQTGRNSGVIHAGVYYRPGSEKARLCTAGRDRMVELCRERQIPFEVCGKVVVATRPEELDRLAELQRRCEANGVVVERIGPERLRELEPHAAGIAALHVPSTGIVDYSSVAEVLAADLCDAGASVCTGVRVLSLHDATADGQRSVRVGTDAGDLEATRVVSCAGLFADRLAGSPDDVRIVPFRGEYHELAPARSHLVRGLIYPVPDPELPFLGVHLTRGISGRIHCGPNAVLALAREGYSWGRVVPRDLAEVLRYPGFHALVRRHWRSGVEEIVRSASRRLFARSLARLVPEVRVEDLEPAPAGVRAQAVRADGSLVDDFLIRRQASVVHVLNAPSPAATASLAIGDELAALALA